MTKSIRETILSAFDDSDYIEQEYGSYISRAVSALEKREALAVANVVAVIEARYGSGHADEAVDLLNREGINTSAVGKNPEREAEVVAAAEALLTTPTASVSDDGKLTVGGAIDSLVPEEGEAAVADQSDQAEPVAQFELTIRGPFTGKTARRIEKLVNSL